jgi:hypothetical protein
MGADGSHCVNPAHDANLSNGLIPVVQTLVQSNLSKRDLFKRDFDLSGTLSFAFSNLSPYRLRWLRGILLQAGLFSCEFDVPLNEI